MKLLAAKTATTATELSLGKATAVAVYASAISIISVVENDGTEGGTNGTVQGSVTVPAASLTVIHKDSDQFLLANVTNGTYTKIASSTFLSLTGKPIDFLNSLYVFIIISAARHLQLQYMFHLSHLPI